MKTFYTLTFVLFCTVTLAQTDNSLNKIRKTVEQTNKDKSLTTKTLDNEQFLQQTTDGGGQLTGYFKNGQLVKIIEWVGLSSCIDITEYYLKDDKLIFVYSQGKELQYIDSIATFNSNQQTLTMECRFYIHNDTLLKSILTGSTRCAGQPSDSWVRNYQDNYLRYIKLLTKK
jgi:hypothetical protein